MRGLASRAGDHPSCSTDSAELDRRRLWVTPCAMGHMRHGAGLQRTGSPRLRVLAKPASKTQVVRLKYDSVRNDVLICDGAAGLERCHELKSMIRQRERSGRTFLAPCVPSLRTLLM